MAIHIASLWNKKAKLWVNGRKGVMAELNLWRKQNEGELIWFHCASLGEFEQGRPLIEELRRRTPDIKILLTFFSPSGYEVRKNYEGADYICYLPTDTTAHANEFIWAVHPTSIFFIKYEYWANYFFAAKKQSIPLYVASAILRPEQRFFGLFRSFWQDVLQCVTYFYVQNESTKRLLNEHGFTNVTISGDTRYDRVVSIKQQQNGIAPIVKWKGSNYCIIGGSTWPADDDLLIAYQTHCMTSGTALKLILVPHETNEAHIAALHRKIPSALRWSQMHPETDVDTHCIIMDTIGLLSTLYQYADAVHVGGGFGKGIHNTLEAAVWGKPITFGPRYHKFDEAKALIEKGAALSVDDLNAFIQAHDTLCNDAAMNQQMAAAALALVQQNAGACNRIWRHVLPPSQ